MHAGVADSRMWQAQIEAIARHHRAIAYDRRGFGATPAVDQSYSEVDDLLAVLEDFADGQPAVIVGCSNGGRIALDAALAAPDCICGLILIAPSVSGAPATGFPEAVRKTVEALEAAEAAGDFVQVNELEAQLWLDGPLAAPGRVSGTPRQLFLDMNGIALQAANIGKALDRPPAYPRLAEIGIPTLIVWGSFEFPEIQLRCQHLLREIPRAHGLAMTGVAHLPSLERPAEVSGLIADFIERLGKAPLDTRGRGDL
jgi:pimeloyl-ACP methyl ester carboxylesterase